MSNPSEEFRLELPIDLSDRSRPVAMVDDEELDFILAQRFYKRSGIGNPFIHFPGGEPFIEYLQEVKAGRAPLPALVFMDINMPRMTGFEVVELMRGDELFRDVPVVSMLTSSSDHRDRERASAVGADSYLVKPYDPRVYLNLFERLAA